MKDHRPYSSGEPELEVERVCALVVDDDVEMRQLLADILTQRGHLAVCAGSAEEGISFLPHYTFQVAYLDYNLPGMDGLVVGEWLRDNNPDMQIALVTAEVDEALEALCRDHAIRYVEKPFDIGDITGIIGRFRAGERERLARRQMQANPFAHPPTAKYLEALKDYYGMPSLPNRVEEQLVRTVKQALAQLHSRGRYTEEHRVAAYAGLLAAKLLGVRLPRGRRDQTLYEEYDALMRDYGREPAFSPPAADEAGASG